MANKPPTDPPSGKDVEGSDPDPSGSSPMERFKSLTKGLLNVPPEKVKEAQAEYEAERGRLRK